MTHEEIVTKIEFLYLKGKHEGLSWELAKPEIETTLTTYRAQVLEAFKKVVDNQDYEWDGGKSAWQDYLDKQHPTN